jgi:3-methyladenine DNA glycosylase AlkD
MDVDATLSRLDRALRAAGSPERAEHERAYLKSELRHYGASVPAIRRVIRSVLPRRTEIDRDALLALVAALWASGVHEQRMAAVELLTLHVELLVADDMATLERLLREARTWALSDPLAAEVVGPLVAAHPSTAAYLDRWARDPDHWLRRSALLAFLLPMRRGEPAVFAAFARHADAMLEEREPFIRKAIGWVLRERTKSRPDEVVAWLRERRDRASGLTLREATKRLGDEQRQELLAGGGTRAARTDRGATPDA